MNTLSLQEFMRLVQISQRNKKKESSRVDEKEVVLRSDQNLFNARRQKHRRHLATCPECDAVVDEERIDPHSGLCPRCHELRRWQSRSPR